MNLNAPSAVNALVWPGNVPELRKLLVKLTLMRAGNATDTQEEVDASTLADDLDIPPSLAGFGQFVRLSEIADVAKGPTGIKDARPGPYPLVVTAEDRGSCDHYDFEGEAVLIPTVSSTGHGDASLKRIHYQEGRFAVGSILAAVRVRDRALNSTRFLYEYLSVFKDELLVARMSGTANVSLTVKKIEGVPIPLIPIAQQQHLHDLMRLCDALEAKGRLEAEQHARLLGTLLGTLTDSSTPEELAANWQSVADHFDLLLDRPEAVDALEQIILQLAVRGLLVPQDPSQEPGIKNSHRSLDTAEDPIDVNEFPFDVPANWRWVRLGSQAELINGDRGKNYPNRAEYVVTGVPFINTGHIEPDGTLSHDSMHYLTRAKFESLRSGKTRSGDLVYCLRGATLGKTAIVEYPEGAIASSLVILRFKESVNRRFAYLFLTSPFGRELIRRFDNGSAQPNLAASSVARYVMPLPPLEEQSRIVARVTELRRVCADLRQRLTASQATQSCLAEALVDQVA